MPYLAGGFALAAYAQLDRLLVGVLCGIAELGKYAAAYSISATFAIFPLVVGASMAPAIARCDSGASRDSLFVKIYSGCGWGAAAIALCLFLAADNVVSLIFGHEYDGAAFAVRLLAAALIGMSVSVPNDYLALAKDKGKVTLQRTLIGLVLNVFCNTLLTPTYGAIGAATAALVAHTLSNTVAYWILMPESRTLQYAALHLPVKVALEFLRRQRKRGSDAR